MTNFDARIPYSRGLTALLAAATLGGCVDLAEVSCTSDDECESGVCSAGVCVEPSGGDSGADADDTGDASSGDTTDASSDPVDDGALGDTTDSGDAATDAATDAIGDSGDATDDTDVIDCDDPNVCGGCEELSGAPGDACGPCELDELRCDGTESVVCSGSTECGDTAFDIVSAAADSESSIFATGEIFAIGDTPPTGHGFCVGPTPNPALGVGDSTCVPLGAADISGTFEATITDLDAGAHYYVRAFVVTLDSTRYSRVIETWTLPPAPVGVEATDGTLEEQVLVTWSPVERASTYRVFRDDDLIAEIDTPYFLDEIDLSDLVPTADGFNLVATAGTRDDGVELTWNEPSVPAPTTYEYTVTATNPAGESVASMADSGAAAPVPVTGYEVIVGPEVYPVTATRFFDDQVPYGAWTPGNVVASDATSPDFVSLSLSDLTPSPAAAVTYAVRAINAQGAGDSASTSGHRGLATPTLIWQWAPSPDESYTVLDGETEQTAIDRSAPASGDVRYYRVCAQMPEVDDRCSEPDIGYRAVGVPTIETQGPFDVTALGARFEAHVSSSSATSAARLGLAWSSDPDPDPATGAEFAEVVTATIPGTYSHEIGPLEAGSTVYVRAYIEFGVPEAQYYFGENIVFSTAPAPPTNVRASDGTSSAIVTIQWDASPGATSYDVYRDGDFVANTAARVFEDADAAQALPPDGAQLSPTATQGVFSDLVRVSWSPPPAQGIVQPSDYTVRAVNESGTSAPSAADAGHRAPSGNLRYEVDVDGTHTVTVPGLRLDDEFAAAPSVRWTEFTASDELSAYYIDLNGIAVPQAGAASTYRVRAVTSDGVGSYSAATSGWRGAVDVDVWVEREIAGIGDGPDHWEEITHLSAPPPYRYTGAVDNGTGYYRAGATVGTAGPFYSDADAGSMSKLRGVLQIVAGTSHFCALFDTGVVRCWGSNTYGQLGYGDTRDRGASMVDLPTPPVDLGGTVSQIAAGSDHTCALLDSGDVVCWGRGRFGRLGYGDEENVGDQRGEMPPPAVDVGGRATAVFAGGQNTCAAIGNRLGCWGYNENAQLGYAPVGGNNAIGDDRSEMPPTMDTTSGWVDSMAIGTTHMCALFHGAYDEVWCWGSATNGAVGSPDILPVGNPYRPRSVAAGAALSLSNLVGGSGFNCVLSSGGVGCWGANESGQLGIGSSENYGDIILETIPAASGAVDGATSIAAGRQHVCAVGAGGEAWCWGNNVAGQLGIGTSTNVGTDRRDLPVEAANLGRISVVLIGAGAGSTCAVSADNDTYCWGANGAGQLANGHVGALGDEDAEMPPPVSWIQ